MTALADLIASRARQDLEDRRRELELADLDRLMRQPGGLAGPPEPSALHDMASARTEDGGTRR
jgi:hypothetical protein